MWRYRTSTSNGYQHTDKQQTTTTKWTKLLSFSRTICSNTKSFRETMSTSMHTVMEASLIWLSPKLYKTIAKLPVHRKKLASNITVWLPIAAQCLNLWITNSLALLSCSSKCSMSPSARVICNNSMGDLSKLMEDRCKCQQTHSSIRCHRNFLSWVSCNKPIVSSNDWQTQVKCSMHIWARIPASSCSFKCSSQLPINFPSSSTPCNFNPKPRRLSSRNVCSRDEMETRCSNVSWARFLLKMLTSRIATNSS